MGDPRAMGARRSRAESWSGAYDRLAEADGYAPLGLDDLELEPR